MQQLIYFETVAELLNFRKAAERLFITQPPLSRQITAMEEELGVQLFIRSKQSVALTSEGEKLLVYAKNILSQYYDMINYAESLSSYNLSIGYSDLTQKHLVSQLIREHLTVHEGTKISLIWREISLLTNSLLNNLCDIVFSTSLHMESIPGLAIEPMDEYKIKLLVSKSHRLAGLSRVPLSEIKDESFVVLFRSDFLSPYNSFSSRFFDEIGITPELRFRCNNLESLYLLVEANVGVAVTHSLDSQPPNYNVSALDIDFPFPYEKIELVAAWKKDNANPALAHFIETLHNK